MLTGEIHSKLQLQSLCNIRYIFITSKSWYHVIYHNYISIINTIVCKPSPTPSTSRHPVIIQPEQKGEIINHFSNRRRCCSNWNWLCILYGLNLRLRESDITYVKHLDRLSGANFGKNQYSGRLTSGEKTNEWKVVEA